MNLADELEKIRQSGMTDAQIGAEVGAGQSLIWRIRKGVHKSTSYERANKILALAKKVSELEQVKNAS